MPLVLVDLLLTRVLSTPQNLTFSLTESNGALLVLLGRTASKTVVPNHPLMNYIRNNAQSWHEYVARRYRGLYAEDNLLIITGWTKTTAWHLASFHQRGPYVDTVTGRISTQPQGGVTISLDDPDSVSIEQRHGPTESYDSHNVPLPDFHLKPTDPDGPGEQCVFIRGYRTKRRSILPGFKIIAAGGSHRSPPRRDRDHSDTVSDGRERCNSPRTVGILCHSCFRRVIENPSSGRSPATIQFFSETRRVRGVKAESRLRAEHYDDLRE